MLQPVFLRSALSTRQPLASLKILVWRTIASCWHFPCSFPFVTKLGPHYFLFVLCGKFLYIQTAAPDAIKRQEITRQIELISSPFAQTATDCEMSIESHSVNCPITLTRNPAMTPQIRNVMQFVDIFIIELYLLVYLLLYVNFLPSRIRAKKSSAKISKPAKPRVSKIASSACK